MEVIYLAALLLGILAHVLKQLVGARRAGGYVSLQCYFLSSWPETLLAVCCSLGLWLALPELPHFFPDLAPKLGFSGQQTALGSFLCGFVGNSLADILGGRLARLVR